MPEACGIRVSECRWFGVLVQLEIKTAIAPKTCFWRARNKKCDVVGSRWF